MLTDMRSITSHFSDQVKSCTGLPFTTALKKAYDPTVICTEGNKIIKRPNENFSAGKNAMGTVCLRPISSGCVLRFSKLQRRSSSHIGFYTMLSQHA